MEYFFLQSNPYPLIKDVIEAPNKSYDNSLLITVIIFVGVNIIAIVLNFFKEYFFRKMDRKTIKLKLREERRIAAFEEVFKILNEINRCNPNVDSAEYLNLLLKLSRTNSSFKPYLSKPARKKITQYHDYCSTVFSDHTNRRVDQEEKYFDDLIKLFNK